MSAVLLHPLLTQLMEDTVEREDTVEVVATVEIMDN
jgi:hypothetical protein